MACNNKLLGLNISLHIGMEKIPCPTLSCTGFPHVALSGMFVYMVFILFFFMKFVHSAPILYIFLISN